MSSWISHLPEGVQCRRVAGPAMNEHELRKNPRLDGYVVQNLNKKPDLPSGRQKGKAGFYGYIVLMFDQSSWSARSRATPSTCSTPAMTACWG